RRHHHLAWPASTPPPSHACLHASGRHPTPRWRRGGPGREGVGEIQQPRRNLAVSVATPRRARGGERWPLSLPPRHACLGAGLHLTRAATRRGRREGRGSSNHQPPCRPAFATTVVAATSPRHPRRRPPPHPRRHEERKARGARLLQSSATALASLLHHRRCRRHLAAPASAPDSTSPAPPRGEEGERGD
ncbi:Os07g0272900, partial [Oryza sativa Japonica Group]